MDVQGMNKSVLVRRVVELMSERDGGVRNYLEASARNLILKRASYTCPIISPSTEEAEVLLQARLSTQPSPRSLAWSCLSII